MWEFTLEESDVYLHLRFREIIFRESILAIFSTTVTKKSISLKTDPKGAYCEACKAKNKGAQDCESCSREFYVMEEEKKE